VVVHDVSWVVHVCCRNSCIIVVGGEIEIRGVIVISHVKMDIAYNIDDDDLSRLWMAMPSSGTS